MEALDGKLKDFLPANVGESKENGTNVVDDYTNSLKAG